MKKVLDNREFWKTMKPFSSDKKHNLLENQHTEE